MEMWSEIRRRVLTGELTKRAACREYDLHWETLEKSSAFRAAGVSPDEAASQAEDRAVSADH